MGLSMGGRQYAQCLWDQYQLDLPRPPDSLCTRPVFNSQFYSMGLVGCLARREKIVTGHLIQCEQCLWPAPTLVGWDLPRAQDRRHSAWPECPTLRHRDTFTQVQFLLRNTLTLPIWHTETLSDKCISYFDVYTASTFLNSYAVSHSLHKYTFHFETI